MPEPPASSSADDFSQRLNEAMSRAQGGAAPAESATPEQTPTEQQAAETEPTEAQDTGPVGSGDHVVRDGECISSIAKDTGHFWETIWDDGANTDLKNTRKDPNVLRPGDRVTIPELRPKDEACATEQLHRFRRKGEPAMLRLRLMQSPEQEPEWDEAEEHEREEGTAQGSQQVEDEPQEDEPRANLPYTLEIDGGFFSGKTDDQGYLQHPIPGNARRGRLILEPGTPNETVLPVHLGHLSPISEIAGVKERLANLGFDCGGETDESTPELPAAIRAFQEQHGLEVTGEPDAATRKRLQQEHGS